MGDVIEFPAGPAFNRRAIEGILEKSLEGAGPEYADCVRKGFMRIWDAYGDRREIYDAELPFIQEMLTSLLVGEINLCKCRFQHARGVREMVGALFAVAP